MKVMFVYSTVFLLAISIFHVHAMELESCLSHQQHTYLSTSHQKTDKQLTNLASSDNACVIIDLTKTIMHNDTPLLRSSCAKASEEKQSEVYPESYLRSQAINKNKFERISSDASYMASLCALPCVVIILLGGSILSFLCIITSKTNITNF